LLDSNAVAEFFKAEKPEYVILAAAKVGGIVANNTYRADFIYENLQIQNNVIHQSYLNDVEKLLFLGSTCIYPKNAPQPMKEDSLLTSELEYTNEPYAIAKIAGIKMCESYNIQYGTNFISVMPTNLYGPNDNFDLETSHVLPALLRKMHEAKLNNTPQVEIWGSGKPRREFLYSEDMADACVFLLESRDFTDTIGEAKATHPNALGCAPIQGEAEATHPRAASRCAPLGAPSDVKEVTAEAEATHPRADEAKATHPESR